MIRVAIVGGGIAGLSLGHALMRRSRPGHAVAVTVFERAARVGGNLRTERVDGFLCEWGPNGFLDSSPDTLTLVHELGLDDRLQVSDARARRRFIYRHGRLQEVPTSPASFFRSGLLSLGGRLRVAWEPFASGPPPGDETIHAFASRRIGQEAADVLIDAMVSGVFGGDARQLSLRACFPRMWQLERDHGSLVRALIARRRHGARTGDGGVGGPQGRLTSFRGGVADLIDALSRSLGPRILTGTAVVGIEPADDHDEAYRLVLSDGTAAEAERVVMAGGAAGSARLVKSWAPELAVQLESIPTAPLAVVCLGYDLAGLGHDLEGFGFLIPRSEGIRSLGVLWDSSIYPGRAPGGQALLRVMIGGATDPRVLDLDDAGLVQQARADLATTMGISADPALTRVFRHPQGIPQYVVGHIDRLARIDRELARHPGLFVAGSCYRGVAINNCVADAGRLTGAILEEVADLAHS
jgi:protoporphyrinogen/coproporphyrinogen III oxidase